MQPVDIFIITRLMKETFSCLIVRS